MDQPIRTLVDTYELLLATLLVQIATVAMAASLLVRFRAFRRFVLTDSPSVDTQARFGILLGLIATIGAWTRINLGYTGVDVSLPLSVLGGLTMGWFPGLVTGMVSGLIPLRHAEWLAVPVLGAIGAGAGLMRRLLARPEAIWEFSPVPFGNTIHSWRVWRQTGVIDSRLLVLVTGVLAETARTEAARFAPHGWLFGYRPSGPVSYYAVIFAALVSIGVALKIWVTPRIEERLARQDSLLAEARFTALRSQMNPHFLFNTLNTIRSLVRTDPDSARRVIGKLSTILRRLLYDTGELQPLREEIEFVRDYLSIEQTRFGEERLRTDVQVPDDLLEVQVPSMVLQPLVENAIKHGLAPRGAGGAVSIGASIDGDRLRLQVADNGVGMRSESARVSLRRGIGLSNIRERLTALYGDDHAIAIDTAPGDGFRITISIPLTTATAEHRTRTPEVPSKGQRDDRHHNRR